MDGQQLFFLIAALVIVAMIVLWALVGRSGGAGHHDVGHGDHDHHGKASFFGQMRRQAKPQRQPIAHRILWDSEDIPHRYKRLMMPLHQLQTLVTHVSLITCSSAAKQRAETAVRLQSQIKVVMAADCA